MTMPLWLLVGPHVVRRMAVFALGLTSLFMALTIFSVFFGLATGSPLLGFEREILRETLGQIPSALAFWVREFREATP